MDLLWLPVVVLAAHGKHRFTAAGFVLAGVFMLRLQVEIMDSIGFDHGFLGLIKAPALERGMATYSVFYLLYAILAQLSPGSFKAVFLAATISIFFMALFVSTIVMVL
jgi:hypothetical protein